jgi:hypothetical protein
MEREDNILLKVINTKFRENLFRSSRILVICGQRDSEELAETGERKLVA